MSADATYRNTLCALPWWTPFLVKKAEPVIKLIPQPTTSPVVNVGPYLLPVIWQQKVLPSSPCQPQLSGSHPGSFSRETFGPEKPIPIILLSFSTATVYAVDLSYPSFPFEVIVAS